MSKAADELDKMANSLENARNREFETIHEDLAYYTACCNAAKALRRAAARIRRRAR